VSLLLKNYLNDKNNRKNGISSPFKDKLCVKDGSNEKQRRKKYDNGRGTFQKRIYRL
jgi:hypothetical protein